MHVNLLPKPQSKRFCTIAADKSPKCNPMLGCSDPPYIPEELLSVIFVFSDTKIFRLNHYSRQKSQKKTFPGAKWPPVTQEAPLNKILLLSNPNNLRLNGVDLLQ